LSHLPPFYVRILDGNFKLGDQVSQGASTGPRIFL
jgi:hypothetical protein